MKIFCTVDSLQDVPSKFRSDLLIVTQSNWQEMYFYLEGKDSMVRLYLSQNTPLDRLLKLFENYPGDMVVYSVISPLPVMVSRFTTIHNRKKFTKLDFPVKSELQELVTTIKGRF